MGGRFTLLLSLCSPPVCLNLPTTVRPLITRYCLPLPPSPLSISPPVHLPTPPPASLHHSQSHPTFLFFLPLTYPHILSLPGAPVFVFFHLLLLLLLQLLPSSCKKVLSVLLLYCLTITNAVVLLAASNFLQSDPLALSKCYFIFLTKVISN